jgi:hypothetical protein
VVRRAKWVARANVKLQACHRHARFSGRTRRLRCVGFREGEGCSRCSGRPQLLRAARRVCSPTPFSGSPSAPINAWSISFPPGNQATSLRCGSKSGARNSAITRPSRGGDGRYLGRQSSASGSKPRFRESICVDEAYERRAAERRATWRGTVAHSFDEAEAISRAGDRELSPSERVELIWTLVQRMPWGNNASQFRLDRTLGRIERRRR